MNRDESVLAVRYDSDIDAYWATHDFSSHSDISTTLCVALEEVAEAEGLQFSRSLYETINPEGLARLFEPCRRSPRNDGKVNFTFNDLDVTVHATGEIVIALPTDE